MFRPSMLGSSRVTHLGTLWIAVVFVVSGTTSGRLTIVAQEPPCFEVEATVPWTGGDLALAEAGASRPASVDGADGYELCSQGGGFGESEGYRILEQAVWHDFELTARLEKIDAIGAAGLIATVDARSEIAAHVRILVRANRTGGHEVRSSYRLNEGATVESETSLPITLPAVLRIRRSGDRITTSFAGEGALTEDLDLTVTGSELDGQRVRVGMVSASEATLVAATACFTRAVLTTSLPKPPSINCLEAFVVPMEGGTEFEISGIHLGGAETVTLAGVPATILERTPTSVRVLTGAFDATGGSRPQSGDVVVTTESGTTLLRNAVVYAGRSFLRGDVNDDKETDISDGIFLLANLFLGEVAPKCLQAAELNGDLEVDLSDAVFLFQHLFSGGPRPAPPYGEPGVSRTGEVCGLPDTPRLAAVVHPDGSPVGPRDTLARDDVLVLRGERFPVDRDIVVLFGDTRTELLERSTSNELHVRILEVPSAGRKCPRLVEVWGDSRLPQDSDGTYVNTVGQASGIIAETDLPDECPQFEASRVEVLATSSFEETSSTLLLEFDRTRWDPAESYRMNLTYFLPVSHRGSRGSRHLSFEFSHRGFRTQPTFEEWLEQLARRLRFELNGAVRADDDCACDLTAEARPNGVAVMPCNDIGDIKNPGPGPSPPFDPIGNLKPPKPPLSGGNSIQSQPIVCPNGEIPPQGNARLLAWCRFAQLTSETGGFPKWEGFVPLNAVLNPELAYHLRPPVERDLSQKRIMYNAPAFYHVYNNNWWWPCMPAAYRAICDTPNTDFMPFFPPSAIVIKPFWRTFDRLPQGSDPDDYYSFRQEVNGEPTGERFYLVGMNIMTKDIPFTWFWATFWVPRPNGAMLTNDGNPFSYNTACTVGHKLDMPDDVVGVWRNYVMCVQTGPGENLCGNPWAPGECFEGCEDCHRRTGEYHFDDDNEQPMQYDWLPSLIRQNENDCFLDFQDNIVPLEPYLPDVCEN